MFDNSKRVIIIDNIKSSNIHQAIFILNDNAIGKEGVTDEMLLKAADKLLGISGIQASFALVKIGNSVHISARSTGKINVQLILEKLQGGGHFDVAGAQVADRSLIEALTMLKESIDHYLDNNM